jgi:membrane-associated phospholipid phosphatase
MKARCLAVLCSATVVSMTAGASADDGSSATGAETTSSAAATVSAASAAVTGLGSEGGLVLESSAEDEDGPGLSSLLHPYLWDGGAVPFLWGALAARVAMDRWVPGRDTPLGFSDEGGAEVASWEVPGWTVTAMGGVVGLAMAAGDNDARWYHVKGLAETLATGSLVTGALKLTFARHRPDWSGDASAGFGGGNRSFPSGHSTQAFEIATYAALYLRTHGFDRYRPHGSFRWWEGVAYAGIYGAATLVAGERVYHHRHHLTDVAAGAALGTATSALFFLYQEHRYKESRSLERRAFLVSPTVTDKDLGVRLQWTY